MGIFQQVGQTTYDLITLKAARRWQYALALTRDKFLYALSVRKAKVGGKVYEVVTTWQKGREIGPLENYRSYALEGFGGNAIVYACVTLIASNGSSSPLRVAEQGEDGTNFVEHDLLDAVLAQPNPKQARAAFLEMIHIYLNIDGNAFIIKEPTKGGGLNLWLPRPDRMKLVPDTSGQNTIGYVYVSGAGERTPWLPEEVIHIKMPYAYDELEGLGRGMSPLSAAATSADVDNRLTNFVDKFFKNAAVPYGLLTTEDILDEDEIKRIRASMRDKYAGMDKWHELMILDRRASYQKVGADVSEISQPDLHSMSEVRICMVYKVPPILIGARIGLEHGTYSNYGEARQFLWSEKVQPDNNRIASAMTGGLREYLGDGQSIVCDYSEIGALQESRDALFTRASAGFNGGFLTQDQARAVAGYEPSADGSGNFFLLPTSMVRLDAATGEVTPLAPAMSFAYREPGQRKRADYDKPPAESNGDGRRPLEAELGTIIARLSADRKGIEASTVGAMKWQRRAADDMAGVLVEAALLGASGNGANTALFAGVAKRAAYDKALGIADGILAGDVGDERAVGLVATSAITQAWLAGGMWALEQPKALPGHSQQGQDDWQQWPVTKQAPRRVTADGLADPLGNEKDASEARWQQAMSAFFREQLGRIKATLEPKIPARRKAVDDALNDRFWQKEDQELLAVLLPLLGEDANTAALYYAAEMENAYTIAVDWSLVNTRAVEWARGYGYDLVSGINQTTARALQQAVGEFVDTPGMNMGQLFDKLSGLPAFGPVRAQMVGVTEVTRAYAEGSIATARQYEADGIFEWRRHWRTNEDELVCPLCFALSQKIANGLDGDFEPGISIPPRHPRCRCWLTLEPVTPDQEDLPPYPVSEAERQLQRDLTEAKQAQDEMRAANDVEGANSLKEYIAALELQLRLESGAAQALWEIARLLPQQATADDWRQVAKVVQGEGYDLYKKYTQEGIKLHVAEKRAAQDSGYMTVGSEHIMVRRGRFSRATAQRMEGSMWEDAKGEVSKAMGKLLRRAGFSASDIKNADYNQRLRLLEELGAKELKTTSTGRASKIDDVTPEARAAVVAAIDYDLAATCGQAAIDPLSSTPDLDAYGKMELADYIKTTRAGGTEAGVYSDRPLYFD